MTDPGFENGKQVPSTTEEARNDPITGVPLQCLASSASSIRSSRFSDCSWTSSIGSHGRRGKRSFSPQNSPSSDHRSALSQQAERTSLYHCTVCFRPCKDYYSWARHERTHFSYPQKWVCMPNDTPFVDGICSFCGTFFTQDNPELSEHYKSHKIAECLNADVQKRTFGEKQNLKQHINRAHQTADMRANKVLQFSLNNVLNHWQREPDASELGHAALWCGFCRSLQPTWKERTQHVASHLSQGGWLEWKPLAWNCSDHVWKHFCRQPKSDGSPAGQCPLCDTEVPDISLHIMWKHRVVRPPDFCRVYYDSEAEFLTHLRLSHGLSPATYWEKEMLEHAVVGQGSSSQVVPPFRTKKRKEADEG